MFIARLGVFFFGAFVASACLSRPIAEVHPETKNLYVDQVAQSAVDKIDLLFMVDNSASMADKQAILREAVPVLVSRLTSPICVDSDTGAPTGESSKDGKCTKGEPEFNPVNDIHVGIVTSSLGSHGGFGNCDAKSPGTPNDRARLLGTVRPASGAGDPSGTFDVSRTWNGSGFLAWDARGQQSPPGTSSAADFQAAFADMIRSAGEAGCGYEASLESWYRFLVDPEPPAQVTKVGNDSVRGSKLVVHPDGSSECQGCDTELLAQRKAFLRPDSLLAIVMLSDENDCSIRDDSQGWYVASRVTSDAPNASAVRMPRATSVCEKNPNDRCCRSCASADLDGCTPLAQDASCKLGALDGTNDALNLRCSQQKRRFGVDLLYPVSRYVNALKDRSLTLQSDGTTPVPNPLYVASATGATRDPSQVFLAGIVGVPWQDIADDASRSGTSRELEYLTAEELVAKGRWPLLIGDPDASPPEAPGDPFMIETPLGRTGTNPITGDAIVPATATSPTASPINGHEQNVPGLDDLQYACTFPLKPSRTCTAANRSSCDCAPDTNGGTTALTTANSPLCQPPAGGAPTTEQRYAKAYPGTRELEVLKGLAGQGIVASICPKNPDSTDPANDPSYGYNPAVAAIIERLKSQLTGKCLPRPVQIDPVTKEVQCKVVEAQVGNCNCAQAGRASVPDTLLATVRTQLEATANCDAPGRPACSDYCGCEILAEQGPDLDACRNNQPESSVGAPGYCYIDDPASPALKNCPANQKRLLRFVGGSSGQKIPTPGAVAFIACLGAAI